MLTLHNDTISLHKIFRQKKNGWAAVLFWVMRK